jgi:glycosyltransferase involved in cell wall biosynthesis
MTSLDTGGTGRQVIELIRRLNPRRWALHLACLETRGASTDRAAEAAQSVTEFPVDGFGRPETCRQAWAFARWCKRRRIAVVHTADLHANIFALPAAACARVPLRVGIRSGLNHDRSPAHLTMQRAAYSCAHVVVANSRADAAQLYEERVPAAKVAIVPTALDLTAFAPRTADTGHRRIIVVGSLRPEEGHDVLIDAAPAVLRRYPQAHFDLVGGGPELASLAARAAFRGVGSAFTFLGARDDVPALLAAADVFVLPSRTEPFPNVLAEAMAAGLPIVASAVGGVPEVIDNGRNGLLVPAGDAGALADRLCRVLDDPALRTRLGSAARADAEARYSFDRMVEAFEAIYIEQLTRRGRGRLGAAA